MRQGDYGALASEPGVAPQRAATGLPAFTPYVSQGQASPQAIWDAVGVNSLNLDDAANPEGLRYSFGRSEQN